MVVGISDTDVAIGVEDAMSVEDVGGSDEAPVLEIRSDGVFSLMISWLG
jgi:hypothetical protein